MDRRKTHGIQARPLPNPKKTVLANNSLTAALRWLEECCDDPRSLHGLHIRLAIGDIESAKELLMEHQEEVTAQERGGPR